MCKSSPETPSNEPPVMNHFVPADLRSANEHPCCLLLISFYFQADISQPFTCPILACRARICQWSILYRLVLKTHFIISANIRTTLR
jgi:hypothetical protein